MAPTETAKTLLENAAVWPLIPASVGESCAKSCTSADLVKQVIEWGSVDSGFVYFIEGSGGAIKIGFSLRPHARIHELRHEQFEFAPMRLVGAIPAAMRAERILHERFAHLRIYREWFEPSPEILDLIGSIPSVVTPLKRRSFLDAPRGISFSEFACLNFGASK